MKFLYLILFLLFIVSCTPKISDNYDISISKNGIIPLPKDIDRKYKKAGFVKYTKVQAPNGKAIHILAQNALSDAQILKSRNILTFYLTNYPNSKFGANKTLVANTMANNHAILMLLNGSDDGNPPFIDGQPLYQNEIAVEGSSWYINNNYQHRDASFEEILHLMHDKGIGIDKNGQPSKIGASPAYQKEIRKAQKNAVKKKYWPIEYHPNVANWYTELANENSLSQEYLASVIDSYYGLWEPWQKGTKGMWGLYIAKTRKEIANKDPEGYALISKFFSPYINVNFDIDPNFQGIFNLTLTTSLPYTFKSQYLQNITLTGKHDSGIKGNDLANKLIGNSANNSFEGGKGNDLLDGKEGEDTVFFTGKKSDYTITNTLGYIEVKDNILNRDGIDKLYNCEIIKFLDKKITIKNLN